MKKILVIFIAAISIFYSASAQHNPKKKTKYYNVWISLNDQEIKSKGILYEVNDSSILISGETPLRNSLSRSEGLTEISYNNIELIKARRTMSIARGSAIGASIGAGIGLKVMIEELGEAVMMFAGAPALVGMFPAAVVGAGYGALLGTIKDRIPIQLSKENFNLYKSTLQTYSYNQEPDIGLKQFQHKGFAGLTLSRFLPVGDHLNAGTGIGSVAGYRFSNHWGISVSQYSWDIRKSSYSVESGWQVNLSVAGPFISVPINNKFRLDFKSGVGISDATEWIENREEKTGYGLGLNLNMSLLYNFSKRGGFLTEAGYFNTRIKYSNSDSETIGSFHLSMGYIYKFSRRSI